MDVLNKSSRGTLKVSDNVISTIAKQAISDIDGVAGLYCSEDLFKQYFIKNIKSDAIRIKLIGDVVEITVSIKVLAGAKVKTLSEHVQEKIKSDVQSMTGITVSKVNVVIAGIEFTEVKN